MKGILTISLDTALIEKLRKEHNYSALLSELLDDYYKRTPDFEQRQILNEMAQEKELEEEIERRKNYEESSERWEKIKIRIIETLPKIYIVDKERLDEIAEDIVMLLRAGRIKNVQDYAVLKEMIRKPNANA